MNIIEEIILVKFKKYKDFVDKDRFILPINKDISFFTNIIDDCCDFIS